MTAYREIREHERVQLRPHRDEWMQGDRFGTIIRKLDDKVPVKYRILMDRSGRILTLTLDQFDPTT